MLKIFFCAQISTVYASSEGEKGQMANHKSAEKRVRQTSRRNEVNKRNRTRLRSQIKKLRAELDAGNRDQAQGMLAETISVIDKSVQKGVLHHNAAARYKSRLTGGVNRLSS
jgi:small subunit ribosomal protein S20